MTLGPTHSGIIYQYALVLVSIAHNIWSAQFHPFQNCKMDHVTLQWTHPFHGWFVIHRLGTEMLNLRTKFEITISTSYEDMKGDAKFTNWGAFI